MCVFCPIGFYFFGCLPFIFYVLLCVCTIYTVQCTCKSCNYPWQLQRKTEFCRKDEKNMQPSFLPKCFIIWPKTIHIKYSITACDTRANSQIELMSKLKTHKSKENSRTKVFIGAYILDWFFFEGRNFRKRCKKILTETF